MSAWRRPRVYAAAVSMALQNRLQAHKRLIVVASAIAPGTGFFRVVLFLSGFHPLSLPIGVLGCSLFIGIGVVYDWLTRQAVHPVYWIGLAALALSSSCVPSLLERRAVRWSRGALHHRGAR